MRKILLLVSSAFLFGSSALKAQTWIEQNSNFTNTSEGVLDISVVDDNTCWALGYDGTGTGIDFIDFAHTNDGGTTFNIGTVGTDTTFQFSNISAISYDTAWVAMFNHVATLGGGIWHTTDGGTTWTQQGVGTIFNASSFPDVVHFWNATDGVAIGDPNNGYFEIYTTTDGGTTWTRTPQANIPANLSAEAGITNWYDTYGDNVWFYTSKGRVYHSPDKGTTWTVGTVHTLTTTQYMNLKFYDANNGIANVASTGGVFVGAYRTSDGGATWTAYTPTGNFWTSDLVIVPNTGIAVSTGAATGFTGSSFSEDTGTTWYDIDSGTQHTALGASSFNGMWSGGFSAGFQSGGIFKYDGFPLAVHEIAVDLKSYNLYPNPTSGIVTLNMKSKVQSVQVIDAMGKIVYAEKFSATNIAKKSFDFSSLAKGIYSLVLTSATERTQEKLVIQ